jgi:hypothetical protein
MRYGEKYVSCAATRGFAYNGAALCTCDATGVFKDGKEHCYWNIVEAKRCADGRVVQRQVLYLGEINDSQHEAWCG